MRVLDSHRLARVQADYGQLVELYGKERTLPGIAIVKTATPKKIYY